MADDVMRLFALWMLAHDAADEEMRATVEGVARALYPEIDIIETARPFVTRVLAAGILTPERLHERVPRAVRAALREMVR